MRNFLPSAQLVRCYRIGEQIYFTIGKAQDRNATISALEEQVPSHARSIDTILNEWRVDSGYEHVLESLFVNFPAIMRNHSGAYLPPTPSPYHRSMGSLTSLLNQSLGYLYANLITWSLWLLIPLIGLALWTWLNIQSANLDQNQPAAEPLSTALGIPEQAGEQGARPLATATPPSPTRATQVTAKVTVLQTANLRTGPGTDFEVREQVSSGLELILTGQVVPPDDDYIWFRLDSGLWIHSQLVSGPSITLPTTLITNR
ncbi:MAG: hypothetical protein AAF702_05920 [Chloroflexota bacterium]